MSNLHLDIWDHLSLLNSCSFSYLIFWSLLPKKPYSIQVAPPQVFLNHSAWCSQLGQPFTSGKWRSYPSRFRSNITFFIKPSLNSCPSHPLCILYIRQLLSSALTRIWNIRSLVYFLFYFHQLCSQHLAHNK